jgi:hypothetical protein
MMNYANAQNLASYGRGNDTQLVHMSPNEVKGLQALALAHGGSLTINPTTGLPEAGFLEKILPMVAGAGLAMIPGVGPLAAAAMVGGGYGLATGSVEKGLMAGLSAYGGAGLATGLAGAGASSLVEEGGKVAVDQAVAKTTEEAAKQTVGQQITEEAAKNAAAEGITLPADYGQMATQQATQQQIAQVQAQNALSGNPSLQQAAYRAENPLDVVRARGMGDVAQSPRIADPTFGQSMSNAGRGFSELGSKQGLASAYASMPTGTLPATAFTMLTPDQQAPSQGGYQEDEYDRRLKGYRLSPNYQAYQAPTPNPYYRPTYAAEGGVMQSFDDEAGVDMASGGIARYRNKGEVNVLKDYLDRQEKEERQVRPLSTNPSSYFPDVGIYRDPDIDTAKKDALTAAMIRLGKAGKGAGIKSVPLPKTSIRGLGDIRGATPEVEEAAKGGVMSHLGGYSDGGRMLKGPGDGMSDSIPATISGKQPARLADGEFVVPADVVSHLGNGSTDAGAKKLYSMMDNIRKARTGKKKQAPAVNAEKYLPGKKKASGGIAGYAEGGITGYAEGGASNDSGGVYADKPFTDAQVASYLSTNNITTPSEISHVQSAFGISSDQLARAQNLITSGDASIGQATSAYKEAIAAAPTQEAQNRVDLVTQIYTQQLGRAPDAAGLEYWTSQLASGKSPAAVAAGINQAVEGQQMDIQSAASAYRQALGRNPEPAGLQYWMSVAQSKGLTANQLKNEITKAAVAEQTQRGIAPGTTFTDMQLAALESDPYAGYFSNQSIYDIAPDAENVSMIDGRKVQFTTPVTRQAVVSNFVNGVYTATPGKEILNMPHVQAAINVARANGTLDEADYNAITSGLNTAKTPADVRSILAKPQANVVVDAIYGQQIGEAKTLAAAQAEAAQRNAVLTAQDPGYYQSNRALTDAYRAAGLTVPFDYGAYQGVDTRDITKNLLTPQNIAQKRTELVNQLNRNNPYRVAYEPINRGIANLPASVQDPYSDAGLAFLYGNMMNQYAPAPPGQVNPATFTTIPYSYTPPPPNNLTLQTPIPDAAKPAPPAPPPEAAPAPATSGGDGG